MPAWIERSSARALSFPPDHINAYRPLTPVEPAIRSDGRASSRTDSDPPIASNATNGGVDQFIPGLALDRATLGAIATPPRRRHLPRSASHRALVLTGQFAPTARASSIYVDASQVRTGRCVL